MLGLASFTEAVSEDGQIRVYFFKEHLKNFTVPFSWEQARLRTQEEIRQGCERWGSCWRCSVQLSSAPSELLVNFKRLFWAATMNT